MLKVESLELIAKIKKLNIIDGKFPHSIISYAGDGCFGKLYRIDGFCDYLI